MAATMTADAIESFFMGALASFSFLVIFKFFSEGIFSQTGQPRLRAEPRQFLGHKDPERREIPQCRHIVSGCFPQ
jgi:hypothetical protein